MIPAHEIEALKLRAERNVDKEYNASTALVKNCNDATEFYEHVNVICTHLIMWLKEDAAKAADATESEEILQKVDLMKQALRILEKQVENLINHDLAHQLDIKDAFAHYKELLRQQFVAVIGLDRAQLNNAALLWKQDLVEASFAMSTAMTVSNMSHQGQETAETMAVETHVGNLNREILRLNAKVFNMQTELQKSYTTISNQARELSNKTTHLSQDSKKLEEIEAQKRKILEDSRRTASAVTFAEAKIKVLEKKLDCAHEKFKQLKAQLESSDEQANELAMQLASKNTTINGLQEKLDAAENKVKDTEAELDSREGQQKDLQVRLASSDDKVVKYETEMDQKVTSLEKTKASLQKTITGLLSSNHEQQKINAALQKKLKTGEEKVKELEAELESTGVQNKELQVSLAFSNDKITKQEATFDEKLTEFQTQLEVGRQEITQLQETRHSKEDMIKQLEEKLNFAEAKATEKASKAAELQGIIDENKEKLAKLSNGAVATEKMGALEKAIKDKDEQIDTLRKTMAEQNRTMEQMRKKISNMHDFMDERDEEIMGLKSRNISLEMTVTDKDKAIEALRKNVAATPAVSNENEEKMTQLRGLYASLHREFAAKVAELEQSKKKAAEAEEIARPFTDSDKARMLNLRKHNEELVKKLDNMANEKIIYKALIEQDVKFLNDNRINGTLFEAGLHRNAPKKGYVSQSYYDRVQDGF